MIKCSHCGFVPSAWPDDALCPECGFAVGLYTDSRQEPAPYSSGLTLREWLTLPFAAVWIGLQFLGLATYSGWDWLRRN